MGAKGQIVIRVQADQSKRAWERQKSNVTYELKQADKYRNSYLFAYSCGQDAFFYHNKKLYALFSLHWIRSYKRHIPLQSQASFSYLFILGRKY